MNLNVECSGDFLCWAAMNKIMHERHTHIIDALASEHGRRVNELRENVLIRDEKLGFVSCCRHISLAEHHDGLVRRDIDVVDRVAEEP